jgi:hypothetical protein
MESVVGIKIPYLERRSTMTRIAVNPLSRKKTLKHSGYVKQSSLRCRDLSLIGQSSVVCISYGLFELNLTRIELFHKHTH